MRRVSFRCAWSIIGPTFLLSVMCVAAAFAQATQGKIVGTIRDESGAVMPGITIRVADLGTGQIRTATTDETGTYSVAQLLPGEYDVAAESPGFRREVIKAVRLQVGQTARVDLTLRVGEFSQEILVTGQTPVVQSDESSIGTVIEEKRVSDLPLNGRDFAQLAVLTPGAILRPSQDRSFSRTLTVHGNQPSKTEWLLDGVSNNEQLFEGVALTPSIDAIREFKVQGNAFAAEFGRVVTPGLIDLHVHVYPGVSHYGIEPDPVCVARGVTTALDLGSAGYYTFPGFRRYVIEKAVTRILAYLNISSTGLLNADYNELEEVRNASPRLAAEMALKHKDLILGIKVRLTEVLKDLDLAVLGLTRQAADAAGIPVAVHVGGMRSSLSEVVSALKPGDMVTHFMHGGENTILDQRGKIRPAIREARQRGVYFDLGHGRSSFSFEVAEKALQDGFLPDSLSSDVHVYNLHGPVFDHVTTLSKFLHLGLTLEQVIERATTRPAQIIRRPDLGTLKVGSEADVAVLGLREGKFELLDSLREKRVAQKLLVPVATVRAGKLIKLPSAT